MFRHNKHKADCNRLSLVKVLKNKVENNDLWIHTLQSYFSIIFQEFLYIYVFKKNCGDSSLE